MADPLNTANHSLIYRAVREVNLALAFEGVELDKPLTTRVKPGFNTACWTFNRDQHSIFMGDAVFPWERAKPMTDPERVNVYKALYRHELAHANSTVRDFPAMNAICRRAKCDFQLLNLFEDARIEHIERETTGNKLGWADFMAQELPNKDANQIFYSMIEKETREVAAEDPALLARVQSYYDRVVSCPDTLQLEPILKEWQIEFPPKQQDKQQGQGKGEGQPGSGQPEQGDGQPPPGTPGESPAKPAPYEGKDASVTADRGEMPLSVQLSNDSKFDEFSADTIDVKDLDPAKKDTSRGDNKDPNVRAQDSLEWDESKQLANMLKKAMQGINRSVSTDVPGKKMNLKGMTRPGAPMFRRKELQGRKSLNVLFVVDISGSMGGEPIKNGRLLAGALSILADQGLAEGKVMLSGSGYNDIFDLKEKDVKAKIEAIGATGGGEGFVDNFIKYQSFMKDRDAVLVFTDSNTERVDQEKLARNKIFPIGLYCGHDKNAPAQLAVNFKRFIVRDDIKELTFSLVQEFAKAAKTKAQGREPGMGGSNSGAALSKIAAGAKEGDAFRVSQGKVSFNGFDATAHVRELANVPAGVSLNAAHVREALRVAASPEHAPEKPADRSR